MFATKNLVGNLVNFLGKNKYNLKEVCFFDDVSNDDKAKL